MTLRSLRLCERKIMKNKSPKIANWFLRKFLTSNDKVSRIDDYEEMFSNILKKEGRFRAVKWYWSEVFGAIPQLVTFSIYWSFTMYRNYLISAFRNFKKQKMYSLINTFGLVIGITVCSFIFLWVRDELSYDRFHKNKDRIYRVTRQYLSEDGQVRWHFGMLAYMFADLLKNDFPEVQEAVRLNIRDKILIGAGNNYFEETGFVFTDKEIFDVFTFEMLIGDISFALEEPFTVVITEEIASKYFGKNDPVGERLKFEYQGQKYDLSVTGIIRSLPENSHFHPDFLASFSTYEALVSSGALSSWGNNQNYTYILLPPNFDHMQLQNKLDDFVDRHQPQGWTRTPLILQKLTDIHLRSQLDNEIEPNGNISYVYLFSITGLLILVIACINYMNLAVSRSISRAKEVGLRKVVGAGKSQIIKQFFCESIVMTLIASLMAVILVIYFLPFFNDLANKDISANFITNPVFLLGLTGIYIFTGIISGTYPAILLASFKPVETLKSRLIVKKSGFSMRTALVIFQFSVSVILIVCVLIISKQVNFIRNKNLGFDKEHIIVLPAGGEIINRLESVKSQLLVNPNVLNVTAAKHMPSDMLHDSEGAKVFLDEDRGYTTLSIAALRADHDYIPTFKIPIAAGRNFSKFVAGDEDRAFIINEEAVKRIGWESPEEAIGKEFLYSNDMVKGNIIGVIKNFHFESLHNQITPFFMEISPRRFRQVAVRIKPENIAGTLSFLKDTWKTYRPDFPFTYNFVDANFDSLYKSEEDLFRIFSIFSALAVLIASLGLLGLASFTAFQRTKEMGIRKVLGAATPAIVICLMRDFAKWIVIANIIGWPTAWFVMNRWLGEFAYKTSIGAGIFFIAFVISITIAVLTVVYHAIKVASINPVESIKYE